MCSRPVRLDEVNGIEPVVFDVSGGEQSHMRSCAPHFLQHNGAARIVPQHHTLAEWRGVRDRAISVASVFYAEDVAHRDLCLARRKRSNGIRSVTKTERGATNLRCMCAVYQLLSMLRM